MFNRISFYSFIEYSMIYINVFLKICLGLVKLSRTAFMVIFANKPYQQKKLNKENRKMAQKLTLQFFFYATLC